MICSVCANQDRPTSSRGIYCYLYLSTSRELNFERLNLKIAKQSYWKHFASTFSQIHQGVEFRQIKFENYKTDLLKTAW